MGRVGVGSYVEPLYIVLYVGETPAGRITAYDRPA